MKIQEHIQPPVVDRIASRVGQQIRETASQIGETAARASDGLEESLGNIEIKFNDLRNSVVDKTKEYSRTTNTYVRENPWVAIGISAGFAFLIGMLIGRKNR